jgi:hypothetical protein
MRPTGGSGPEKHTCHYGYQLVKSAPTRRELARFNRPESLITISKGAALESDAVSASV